MSVLPRLDHADRFSPPGPSTRARFAEVVGAAHVLDGRDGDVSQFLEEPRALYHGRAALVLRPGSTGEVSAVMQIAHETGTAIIPQGGNTGLVGGQVPFGTGSEVIVSLGRLNRLRAIDPVSNAVTVEAGMTLAQARTEAEAVDRLFPLSLASEGSCQIGGNLATNAGGMSVLAYGNMRELTLGLEVVTADGRVWNGLKTLRKDNTGYDLRDLFIGSEGTLGLITAATLKLFPKPAAQATAFAAVTDPQAAVDLLDRAQVRSGGQVTRFEIMPRIGVDFVLKHGDSVRDPLSARFDWYALFELSSGGSDDALGHVMQDILAEAIETGRVADAVIAASLQQQDELWRLRELMSQVQKLEGGSIKHDVSVPVAAIPALIEDASAAARRVVPDARPVPFGHIGDGNIHFNVSQPVGMDREAFLARWDDMADAVHGVVLAMGGSISAEHGIGRMKRDTLAATADPVGLELMHSIKRSLDPKGILNPGKVL